MSKILNETLNRFNQLVERSEKSYYNINEKITKKPYEFQNANLFFYGTKIDMNGNKVGVFSFPNSNKFSIQSLNLDNGSLFYNSDAIKGSADEKVIIDYIYNFGSPKQKAQLKVYSDILKEGNEREDIKKAVRNMRSNMIHIPETESPDGEDHVLYVDYDEIDNVLYAGYASNSGVNKAFTIQYDLDFSLDENLQELYDKIFQEIGLEDGDDIISEDGVADLEIIEWFESLDTDHKGEIFKVYDGKDYPLSDMTLNNIFNNEYSKDERLDIYNKWVDVRPKQSK